MKDLIDKLSKAVSFQYPGKCAPSVVISWLPTKEWYVSIVKYEFSANDKQIMHKTRNQCLTTALQVVSRQLLDTIVEERNPLDELNNFLTLTDKSKSASIEE